MLSTQHVVIVIPKRTPDCPEPRAFQKNFAQKKHIAIPMTRARDKRLTCPWGIQRWVNRCAVEVLWCGRGLWVKTAHSYLPSFALCRKTTANKQRAQNGIKWPWIERDYTKRQQQAQVYVSIQFNSIFMPIFLRFNNYFECLTVLKSFVICKTV